MKITFENYPNFYIKAEDTNFTLCETYMGKDKNKQPKQMTKTHGYFSSIEGILQRMAYLIVHRSEETIEMNNYIALLREVHSELIQSVRWN